MSSEILTIYYRAVTYIYIYIYIYISRTSIKKYAILQETVYDKYVLGHTNYIF